jgi:hypothetical protein
MRVTIRGFAGKRVVFEDRLEIRESDLEDLIVSLAQKHANRMANHQLHMIEFEFPDEPISDRYFCFGTDPSGMVMPIAFPLD